jgi:uncharacterized membrane protein
VNVGSMWLLAGLVMLVWLVVVLSVAWLRATRPGGGANVPTYRAREILADRYARGEIDPRSTGSAWELLVRGSSAGLASIRSMAAG